MSIGSEQDIERAIDDTFGAGIERTVTVQSSGAISIEVKAGGRVIVIDGVPAQTEWGVSVDPDEAAGFAGHDVTVPSLAEALRSARDSVDG